MSTAADVIASAMKWVRIVLVLSFIMLITGIFFFVTGVVEKTVAKVETAVRESLTPNAQPELVNPAFTAYRSVMNGIGSQMVILAIGLLALAGALWLSRR